MILSCEVMSPVKSPGFCFSLSAPGHETLRMVMAGRRCYTAVPSMVDTKQLQETLAQDLCAGDGVQGSQRGAQAPQQGVKHCRGKTQTGLLYVPCHRQEQPRCRAAVWEGASPACDLVHKTSKHSRCCGPVLQVEERRQAGRWYEMLLNPEQHQSWH